MASIDVRQDGADYNRLYSKGKELLRRLLALRFLALPGHVQVHAPSLAIAALVKTLDNFFHGTLDSFLASPLVTANPVFALFDDVTVPAGAHHVPGWIRRFYRYDFVVLFYQGNNAPLIMSASCFMLVNLRAGQETRR